MISAKQPKAAMPTLHEMLIVVDGSEIPCFNYQLEASKVCKSTQLTTGMIRIRFTIYISFRKRIRSKMTIVEFQNS